MELRLFLSTLRKRWYVPVIFLVLATVGMYLYHRDTDMETAQTTLAVLDPLVAKPGTYQEAQVTFDSVVKSNQLARRVAARTGLPDRVVSGRVSAGIIPTLSSFNASPLYGVKAKGKTRAEALALATAVTTEARKLYIELNSADTSQIRAALQPELQKLQKDLQEARDAYNSFTSANHTAGLTAQIDRQRNIVASLQQSLDQARAAEGAAGVSHGRTSQALARQLAIEQAQLDRLTGLESRFNELAFNLQLAQDRMSQFSQTEQATVIGEQLPAQLDVKLLDGATIQSPFFYLFLTYATAFMLGLLVGLSVVYVIGLYQKPYQSADEIARTFGTPVLVRVPRATS